MRTSTAKVLPFELPTHDKFTASELRIPRLSKNLTDVINQVKPLFNEWMLADGTFEHNTIEVAKAIGKAWDLFKAAEPQGTKAGFARFFDATIPEDAKVRDLASNAAYNRILYLLHKVAPAGDKDPSMSLQERTNKRVRYIRREWRRFRKQQYGEAELKNIHALVASILAQFLPAISIDRALS